MKKIYNILIAMLVLSIAVSFPINFSSTVTGDTIADSIQAYGDEAQTFAAALQDKILTSNVIVTSNMNKADLASLQPSLTDGTTLVAINLPKNNPLVSIPTLQLETNSTTYEKTENSVYEPKSESVTTEVDPAYYIVVMKYSVPLEISTFATMNYTEECRQQIISEAIKAICTSEVHLPGTDPTTSSTSNNSPIASATILPDFSTQYWNYVAEIDYYLNWNAYDFVRAEHSIYETTQYETVTNREYWLVSSYFESQFGTYSEYWDEDPYLGIYLQGGPYFESIQNQIDGDIPYNQYLPLMQHGPGHTNPDEQATIGFNLGINSGGQGTIGVSYSYSWAVNQNSYDVTADPEAAYVSVTENLAGDSTHVNHYTWQTAVFQTVNGTGFELSDLRTTWNMGYYRYYINIPYYEEYDYSWSTIWNPARLYGPLDNVPSYKYVSSLPSVPTNPYTYGTAGVSNQNNIIGSTNDGNYAYLYALSNNAMVHLHTALNSQASSGCVVVYGYAEHNYNSRFLVYVSTDNYNWYQICDTYVYGTSCYPIDCGYYSGSFNYILLVAYDSGTQSKIYIDSVRVMP